MLFAVWHRMRRSRNRLGEEKTYLLMRRVLQEMTEAVRAHEGIVQGLLGDGLLAVFGAPVAQENAPLEACRAAQPFSGFRIKGLLVLAMSELSPKKAPKSKFVRRAAVRTGRPLTTHRRGIGRTYRSPRPISSGNG